jgi:sugar fermentation stimulation protein A
LKSALLIGRRKRFLADMRLASGRVLTVHCPNPGAMTGCDRPGSAVLLSDSGNPRRKLRHTWELVRVGRTWVCVNTHVANRVVGKWLEMKHLLPGYERVRPEVRLAGSRFDFVLDDRCVVEVKSVTLKVDGIAAFPDAVTERGRRHLETLAALQGMRRVLVYFVARNDVNAVRPADEIDSRYGEALRRALEAGVEVLAVRARFTRRGVERGPLLDVIV